MGECLDFGSLCDDGSGGCTNCAVESHPSRESAIECQKAVEESGTARLMFISEPGRIYLIYQSSDYVARKCTKHTRHTTLRIDGRNTTIAGPAVVNFLFRKVLM
jgi:hypothetical protein